MDEPIIALQTLDSEWSVHKSIEVNLSKLRTTTKFSGMTLIAFIITSVKYHLKLLNAKLLLPMISLK